MSLQEPVLVEISGSVMHVIIQRPERLNAINFETHIKLSEAFDRFADDPDLIIATITGKGTRAFCVGTDLKERQERGKDRIPETGFAGLTQRFDLNKPVVALVNGDVIGGGLEIVLACDLAISVDHARFGLPEPRVGLAASGGLHRLSRYIPMKHAMEIALKGNFFDAQKALHYGLINQVVKPVDFQKETQDLLESLMECAPLALSATKQMLIRGSETASLKKAYQTKYTAFERMLASEDASEGTRAFLEKRKPIWTGN